ncbi:MAG: PEGA domain-containing protein [Kiritimatiellales bacterium]|nr:PEGA domain-containing protein [Kiritimatiellales bacterium]
MVKKIVLNLIATGSLAAAFLVSGCASVTVSSTPTKANVYYKASDKPIGATPVKLHLYANAKEIVVRKDGYFSQTVLLSTIDPKNISVELKRRDKVLLLSQPTGAELFVEGQEQKVGKTPYLLDYKKPFRTFKVSSPGYASQTITIPEDPESNVMVELKREASVSLVSKPKNVEIFSLDGAKLGVTPFAVPAVEEGTYELRKEGYYSLQVTVGPETENPYVVELEREPIIIVYSDPEDAIVVHRGVTLGKTPYRQLVKEDMDLEISIDRYYTKQITIAPDSPRQVSVKLDPKPYIMVKSSPAGADLYRSGGVELIGKTPVEVLVEKDTALEIHKPGYDIKPFMLSPNSNNEVVVPLSQSLASLDKKVLIDSDPSGARVYRPGGAELIGTTPLEQQVHGERTFELQLDGFKTKIVTVAPDSADNVVFALAKDDSAGNVTISDPLLNTPSSF